VQVTQEQLSDVVATAWQVTVGLAVEPCAPDPDDRSLIWAQIPIQGSWQGQLAMGAEREVLDAAASTMFGCADDQVTMQDVEDVALELINVVGGNLAPVIGEDCRIGLPKVGDECEPSASLLQRFAVDGGRVVVSCHPAG